MASRTAYSTWTPQKPTHFDGHYLRNRSTLDIGVLGYIAIVQHKEHSPEVLSIPPGTPCIMIGWICSFDGRHEGLIQNCCRKISGKVKPKILLMNEPTWGRQGSQYIDVDNVVFRQMTIVISNTVSISLFRIGHKGRTKKVSLLRRWLWW